MYEKGFGDALNAYERMLNEASVRTNAEKDREDSASNEYVITAFGKYYLKMNGMNIEFVLDKNDANKFKSLEDVEGCKEGLIKIINTFMAEKK